MWFKPITDSVEWAWARIRCNVICCQDSQGIVAYDQDKIVAVAVFDSFTVDACNVHWAIDNPFVIRAGFISEIARHLFVDCERDRIFGLVPSDNKKALKFDTHIGMVEVARIPDAYAKGTDYIVLRMDKENCRWLEQRQEAA